MAKSSLKRCILLVVAYFIGSLSTSYFFNDTFEIVSVLTGTFVFGVFIFIAELLYKRDEKK
ncbi:hypothetical protein QNK01_11755 (plasmid) [Desemzia incerta]|uniref:hypothetical protein n=1 Tax=Desemzia incerta TaxID=82801 RepID=UPI0024C2CF0A|nr:hypothetical protein [Desemzia incerta]WHZ33252.1 hypothetical protein QNK01_11755 [Desemzia incerta]